MPPWIKQVAFIAASIAIPILWGWLINWLFTRFGDRSAATKRDESFMDYQI